MCVYLLPTSSHRTKNNLLVNDRAEIKLTSFIALSGTVSPTMLASMGESSIRTEVHNLFKLGHYATIESLFSQLLGLAKLYKQNVVMYVVTLCYHLKCLTFVTLVV